MNMGISSGTALSMHQRGQQQRKTSKMGSPRCKGTKITCNKKSSADEKQTNPTKISFDASASYRTQRRWKTPTIMKAQGKGN
jgi:hypothetical protein